MPNVADGEHMSDLIDECKENGNEIDKLYGDSACVGRNWEEKGRYRVLCKVPQVSNSSGGYTKKSFMLMLIMVKLLVLTGV